MQSASFDVSLRRQSWAVDAGFLRIARSLSTVQGGYLSAGPLLHWKQVLFLPSVGALGGESYASRDTTATTMLARAASPDTWLAFQLLERVARSAAASV